MYHPIYFACKNADFKEISELIHTQNKTDKSDPSLKFRLNKVISDTRSIRYRIHYNICDTDILFKYKIPDDSQDLSLYSIHEELVSKCHYHFWRCAWLGVFASDDYGVIKQVYENCPINDIDIIEIATTSNNIGHNAKVFICKLLIDTYNNTGTIHIRRRIFRYITIILDKFDDVQLILSRCDDMPCLQHNYCVMNALHGVVRDNEETKAMIYTMEGVPVHMDQRDVSINHVTAMEVDKLVLLLDHILRQIIKYRPISYRYALSYISDLRAIYKRILTVTYGNALSIKHINIFYGITAILRNAVQIGWYDVFKLIDITRIDVNIRVYYELYNIAIINNHDDIKQYLKRFIPASLTSQERIDILKSIRNLENHASALLEFFLVGHVLADDTAKFTMYETLYLLNHGVNIDSHRTQWIKIYRQIRQYELKRVMDKVSECFPLFEKNLIGIMSEYIEYSDILLADDKAIMDAFMEEGMPYDFEKGSFVMS